MPDWGQYVRDHLNLPPMEGQKDEAIVQQLAEQLEECYLEAKANGATDQEARRDAETHIESWDELAEEVAQAKSRHVRSRADVWMESTEASLRRKGAIWAEIAGDVRYALRSFRRSPIFLLVTVAILALGIGANSAIFSVLKALVLEPLPYPQPQQLVTVWTPQEGYSYNPLSTPNFLDYEERQQSLSAWGAYGSRSVNLAAGDRPERLPSIWCTGGVLEALGVDPPLGRLFKSDAGTPEDEHVVVLSHSLWQRSFDGDPELLGRTVSVNGDSYTVLGVMPQGFEFPGVFSTKKADLFLPLALEADEGDRDSHSLWTLGRLQDGVTREQAQADFDRIASALAEEHPDANSRRIANVIPLHELVAGGIAGSVWVLMAAVGLVLLIACANVASLLLARAVNRQTEIAVRASMGAGRFRLIQQMLTESLMLTTLGGILGVLLAWLGARGLKLIIPSSVPRIHTLEIDGWVLLFSLAVTLATGLIFGLLPALSSSRVDLTSSLREGRPGHTPGRRQARFLASLVVLQFALALVLGNAAVLMWRSLEKLLGSPELSRPEEILAAGISLQGTRYEDLEERNLFWNELLEEVAGLPGVEHASATNQLPFRYGNSGSILVDGEEFDRDLDRPLTAFTFVGGDYFQAVGTPLIQGRNLEPGDSSEGQIHVVINKTLAQNYWPGESALGKRLRHNSEPPSFDVTVVGVVEGFRQWGLEGSSHPEIYFPLDLHEWTERYLVIRAFGDPRLQVQSIRRKLQALDPGVPLSGIQTGDELYARSSATRRFTTLLFALFAALSLVLVAAGIYGVMSFFVTRRTQEIGIRVALGAEVSTVLRMVLVRALRLSFVGIGLGLMLALLASRIMGRMLYGVSPLDVISVVLTVSFLLLLGLAVSLIPAKKAASLDPVKALQAE